MIATPTRRVHADQALYLVAACATAAALGAALSLTARPTALAAGIVVATALAAVAVRAPAALILASFLVVPLERLVSVRSGAASFSPSQILLIAAAVATLAHALVRGRLPFTSRPLDRPLRYVVLATLPGLLLAGEKVPVVKVVVTWAVFYLVFTLIVARADHAFVHRLLSALTASGAVIAVEVVVDSLTGRQQQLLNAARTEAAGRATGAFGSPNALGGYLAAIAPVALGLAFASRRPALRAWYSVAAGLCVLGILLSLSRGAILGLLGALAVLLLWVRFRRLMIFFLIALVPVSLIALPLVERSNRAQVISARVESIRYGGNDSRVVVWRRTPGLIADHPLVGVGAGNFVYHAPRYGMVAPDGAPFPHAHDIVLAILSERGVVGFVPFVWLTLAAVGTAVAATRVAHTGRRAEAFGVAAGLSAMALHGLIDYTLVDNILAATFFVLLACASALASTRQSGEEVRTTA